MRTLSLSLFTLLLLWSPLHVAVVATSSPSTIWSALNSSVQGRLYEGTPLSLPCFSEFNNHSIQPDTQLCRVIQENYTNPAFRDTRFGAYMLPQWETCQSAGQGCLLNSTNPFDPAAYSPPHQCSQGSVASYYIEVGSAADVQHAFKFSERTGTPLIIKNSGHDYKGRASLKGSLALWTHNLDSLSYDDAFIPAGCTTKETYKAMTVGAGVGWQSAYAFADQNNVTIVGGYHETVGASGGWLLGGGHSVLSPVHGLGVDRVLQLKIVTPDGELRIANECQNEDLFWALRGGGGGTFGVVLESTQLVEPKLSLQVAFLYFTPNSTTELGEFYSMLIENTLKWWGEGWGGHIEDTAIIYVNPLLELEEATLSMKPAADFINARNGTVVIETVPSWYEFYSEFITAAETDVGPSDILSSRLIPSSVFEDESGREQLLEILLSMAEYSLPYIPVVGPSPGLYKSNGGSTSVTPAWRNAPWHVVFPYPAPYNATPEVLGYAYALAHNFTLQLHELAPDSGAYSNECEVYEPNHIDSFWGPNYPRLLEMKFKYDPHHLLDCWQCVGWKGPKSPRYSCYLPTPRVT